METLDSGLCQWKTFPIYARIITEEDIVAILIPTKGSADLCTRDRMKKLEVYTIRNDKDAIFRYDFFHLLTLDHHSVDVMTQPTAETNHQCGLFAITPIFQWCA